MMSSFESDRSRHVKLSTSTSDHFFWFGFFLMQCNDAWCLFCFCALFWGWALQRKSFGLETKFLNSQSWQTDQLGGIWVDHVGLCEPASKILGESNTDASRYQRLKPIKAACALFHDVLCISRYDSILDSRPCPCCRMSLYNRLYRYQLPEEWRSMFHVLKPHACGNAWLFSQLLGKILQPQHLVHLIYFVLHLQYKTDSFFLDVIANQISTR